MTIETITPLPRSTIGAGASISFTVADTYTQMDIQADGASVYTTAGGPQSGYTVKVAVSGGYHIFTIKKTAGWATHPVVVQVTEDQDTDVRLTVFSYDLPGVVRFPPQVNPAPSDFIKLRVSEDDGTPIEDVSWIDVVSGTPPDGMTATSAGPPDAQIEATAATTDPDALHGSVAGEINALTDKGIDATIRDDLVVLEDSEAGYVKKSCLVSNLIPNVSPSKLDADFGCQLLYKFNGNYNNDGPLVYSALDPLATGLTQTRPVAYFNAEGGEEGRFFTNDSTSKAYSVSIQPPSTVSDGGECTVQWVGSLSGDSLQMRGGITFSHGATLMACKQNNSERVQISWGLFLDCDGVNAAHYFPSFEYHDAAGTTLIQTIDTSYVLIDYGRYHIAGRRQADGLGTYNNSLWVNGLKVAETTGQVAGYVASTNNQRVGCGSQSGNEGLQRTHNYCAKYSNTALTDAQINSEYKKALGYA